MESDVQEAVLEVLKVADGFESFDQAVRQGFAPGLNPDDTGILKIAVIFNELVGKTVEDEVEFLLRKDDPAGSHGRQI